MTDSFNRNIEYLRISITDRCNLRCNYCMPEDLPYVPHENILRYEEILRICSIMAKLGIKNLRVTGGEPLVRKGCIDFIGRLKTLPGIEKVFLTTNATLLALHAKKLADLNLDGVNISLDSCSGETYQKITGKDKFSAAWKGIETALQCGLKVKLNCVPITGINEGDILPLVNLTRQYSLSVRFIELMPTRVNKGLKGIPGEKILEIISAEYDLTPDKKTHGYGPAMYFKAPELKGSIGLISPLSNCFCFTCNRIRLSPEGCLQLCLHHNEGLDLRTLCRSNADDEEIARSIIASIAAKPKEHVLREHTDLVYMSRIGG